MTFRELPTGAKAHVALVIGAGAIAFGWSVGTGAFEHPWILISLVELTRRRADGITIAVAGLDFEGATGQALPFCASAGVAMFPADGRT